MKDLSWLKHDFIAHRGFHNQNLNILENTKEAFEYALQKEFSIECDLNMLKDGTVVVFHDKNLNRLCSVDKDLKDLSIHEIRNIRLKDKKSSIITLEELIQIVKGKKPLLIELKPFNNPKIFVDRVMDVLKDYHGPYALFSFHPMIVYQLKKKYPHVIRGQISSFYKEDTMNPIARMVLKRMWLNLLTKPDFISYHNKDLPNKYATRFYRKKGVVISFVAQTEKEFTRIRSLYHNVVFEHFEPKK